METFGAVNIYICDAGHALASMNLNNGTTPFLITCECGKQASSSFYSFPKPIQQLSIRYVWYVPTKEQFDKMPKEMQEHVLRGGLIFSFVADDIKHVPECKIDRENFEEWSKNYYE